MGDFIPESVRIIGEMNFEGNIIPHEWYKHIRFKNGKVDINAIIILSEIVYWHRPTLVKDESSGQVLGYKKRFNADLLQSSYDSFAEQFGFTKRQASDAIKRLEDFGLLEREFRNIFVNGMAISNVLYIKLNAHEVVDITRKSDPYHVVTSEGALPNVTPKTLERLTYTESTTKITTKTKEIKRHIISKNDGYVLSSYISRYEDKFKKEHPTVRLDQLEVVKEFIDDIESIYDIDSGKWDDIIDYHFKNLSSKNNGSVLSFASGDSAQGAVRRYIEEIEYVF
ncbi:hypothetical protein [Sporosarcina limicola]|uniref:Replication protein n=1 Tax=Sporosarcina limicola TaxID=34101 RepID=A0A927MKU3_9BACL|nr:hypothetical protein [Sporosarcina limicola]MBE1554787.1 hypothetical protein [Sporosarcina limicola]